MAESEIDQRAYSDGESVSDADAEEEKGERTTRHVIKRTSSQVTDETACESDCDGSAQDCRLSHVERVQVGWRNRSCSCPPTLSLALPSTPPVLLSGSLDRHRATSYSHSPSPLLAPPPPSLSARPSLRLPSHSSFSTHSLSKLQSHVCASRRTPQRFSRPRHGPTTSKRCRSWPHHKGRKLAHGRLPWPQDLRRQPPRKVVSPLISIPPLSRTDYLSRSTLSNGFPDASTCAFLSLYLQCDSGGLGRLLRSDWTLCLRLEARLWLCGASPFFRFLPRDAARLTFSSSCRNMSNLVMLLRLSQSTMRVTSSARRSRLNFRSLALPSGKETDPVCCRLDLVVERS